jgi:hypothetical protein
VVARITVINGVVDKELNTVSVGFWAKLNLVGLNVSIDSRGYLSDLSLIAFIDTK